MKNILFLIFGGLSITGCTTIGQQITNHSGVLQIEQQNIPFNAQSTPSTATTLDNLSVIRTTPNQFYTRSTIVNDDYVVVRTNKHFKKSSPAVTTTNNSTNKISTTNATTTNSYKKISTNNVTVNVYTDSVNIKESSFLSDAYNYFFSE